MHVFVWLHDSMTDQKYMLPEMDPFTAEPLLAKSETNTFQNKLHGGERLNYHSRIGMIGQTFLDLLVLY